MSRYRVQLVPQGAIAQAMNIGVRLTPIGVPPPAEGPADIVVPPPCVLDCVNIAVFGWDSVDGVANALSGSNEFPVGMSGGPWTVQVFINELTPQLPPLCGKSTTWLFSGDLVQDIDFVVGFSATTVIWLFGMKGCDPAYIGNLTIQPQIDGVNFCDPITLAFDGTGAGCEGGGGLEDHCFRDEADADAGIAGISFPNTTTTSIPFTDVGSNAGGAVLYWQITQTAGPVTTATPSITSGDQINYTFDVGNGAADDLTGVNFVAVPFFDAEFTNQYCNGFVFFCEDL